MSGARLFFKFIGIELIAFFVLLTAILAGYGMHRFNSAGSELSADLASTSYRLAGALGPLVEDGNFKAIRSILATVSGNRSVECISLSSDINEIASWPVPDCMLLIPSPFSVTIPVRSSSGKEINLALGYTDAWVKKTVRQEISVLSIAVLVAGFVLAITGLVSFRLVIGRGLKQLIRAINLRTRSGERVSAQWDSNDELGDVVRCYNDMLAMDGRRERENAALRDAEARAQAESKAKSDFVTNVSHEFRTPLNAILGLTDLMLSEDTKDHRQNYLLMVKNAGDSLSALIDDVLAFSSLEDGSASLDIKVMPLTALTNSCRAVLQEAAVEKGLSYNIGTSDRMPEFIYADVHRVRQVLDALVDNAIKFTASGSISVDFEVLPRSVTGAATTQDHSLFIRVADTGDGIDKSQLETLFDQFTQADPSNTRRYGGLGLGLAIANRIVRLMGGTIDVESEPGKGCLFIVEIPCRPAQAPTEIIDVDDAQSFLLNQDTSDRFDLEFMEPEKTPAIAVETPLHPEAAAKVLVVDDSVPNLLIASAFLKNLGYKPMIANNGWEAIDLVRDNMFDLILMDLQMPGLDGIETTRQIHSLCDTTKAPPIIALTANATPSDVSTCNSAGMSGFITKPINSEKLAYTVELALHTKDNPDTSLWALDRTGAS